MVPHTALPLRSTAVEEGETKIGPWGKAEEEWDQPPQPQAPASRSGAVQFLGSRAALAAILLRGYLLTFLTVGIYRFWLVTQKRRFYWSNTLIDGHPLEYTGRSIQLLIGFLLAIVVFVPIYGGAFYLSTVFYEAAAFAYLGMFVILYFLAGYAAYRGRRFRLTRTLWRGICFGQTGNAWAYAIRRFLWTIVTIVTLGLTYPLMVVSLYRYRFENTWFGDRQFSFTGRAREIIGPFLLLYAVVVLLILWLLVAIGAGEGKPSSTLVRPAVLLGLVSLVFVTWFRARIETKMLSSIRLGEAHLRVNLKGRSLLGQYTAFGLLASLVTFLFLLIFVLAIQAGEGGGFAGLIAGAGIFGRGLGTLVIFAMAYLGVLATYALLWDVILSLGYWKIIARGAVIENIDDLRTVRARHEESPVIGEGLADALNVGAY